MLLTALLSYAAGLLTVLAPCVLPLLPIILGGSFDPNHKDKWRPYIITASLAVSLIIFTILLKASTVLIGVDPSVWSFVAGGIVIALGTFMLFPDAWARLIASIGLESRSQALLGKANSNKSRTWSAILTGAALGPVFSSCSPTYAWVIATVLPANAALGIFYLSIYVLGVATSLLAIALLGRRLLSRITWASDPKGWFQRIIAVLFILVGIFLITGWDKRVQTWLVERDLLNLIQIEQNLVPEDDDKSSSMNSQITMASTEGKEYFNVDPYPAPELRGTGQWFNSEELKLEELKGKVVLIDFWTYSCINCIRTFPFLKTWHETYKDDGLVIVGVHAPEFQFEKLAKNVQDALNEHGLKYPVVQDNDFKTWAAYKNRFWPAHYLIDKDGDVRREHFGEGEYEETEAAIRDLLAESGSVLNDGITITGNTTPPISGEQTPETYLGFKRGERFANGNEFKPDETVSYSNRQVNELNQWSLEGDWEIRELDSVSQGNDTKLKINFSAKEVYLVMEGGGSPGSLTLNDEKVTSNNFGGADVDKSGNFYPDKPNLYKLIKSDKFIKGGILEINIPRGTTVNAFTFGS